MKTTVRRWPASPTDLGMLILTGVIVVSVVGQTFLMYKQSAILEAADRREQDRHKPNIMIRRSVYRDRDVDSMSDSVIFTITNASPFDVTITDMELVTAVKADRRRWKAGRASIFVPRLLETRDGINRRVSSQPSLVHRLEYGESIGEWFDADVLIDRLRTENGQPLLVRFECRDSLGNIHVSDGWYSWDRGTNGGLSTTVHDNPGTGIEPQWFTRPWFDDGVDGPDLTQSPRLPGQ